MTKGTQIALVAIVILLIGGGYYYFNNSEELADDTSAIPSITKTKPKSPMPDITPDTVKLKPPVVNEQPAANNLYRITLKTNQGDIVFQTYDADAPLTVQNFVNLASSGFYDGVIFHRVIEGFMIQGGDPTGTGRGGPGYKFADELNPATESYKNGYKRGVVAMANAGPNTNGSQFFIMHQDYSLPNQYSIFGHVVEGQDVVDKIATSPTGPGDKPVNDIVIKSVDVEAL